jgi:hypothetical protein
MGLLALAPYALFHGMFARLFWFGDEFDMVDQIDTNGFWHWTFAAYGENFVPLFKVIWGSGVLAFGGSYSAMMAVVWLAHAVNVVILGRLMRACELPWVAVLLAQVVFGLTPATIETLAWSVQLSSMLSVTFLLLALDGFFRAPFRYSPIAWAAASALSFARGLLTGPVLSCASLWPNGALSTAPLPKRAGFAALYAAPAVAIGVLMAVLAPSGNQGHMEGHWGEAAAFGAWYYFLNPAYHLLGVESWGPRTVVILGMLKVALVAWSLARSRGRMQALLAVLAAFDLGNAVLLGIGRYQTGLLAAVSSRYQYAALVAILPAAGFLFARLLERLPAPGAIRRAAAAAVLALFACCLCRQWGADLDVYSESRGTGTRRILIFQADPGPIAVPGYPGFSTQRAKDLIAKYHLH